MSSFDRVRRLFAWPVSALFLFGCATVARAPKSHVLRLKPGLDVRQEIQAYANAKDIRAGSIVSAVGSLTQWNMRFSDQPEGTKKEGRFEIVSLSGTVAASGSHLHMSVADSTGAVVGGHLLEENLVFTTLELVIQEYPGLVFSRQHDPASGYNELVVTPDGPLESIP